jgi:DNA-binding protein YbaB
MKLPKGFGANNMMAQASQAISRMQNLEEELKNEHVTSEQNGVKVVFDGSGELVTLSIDKSLPFFDKDMQSLSNSAQTKPRTSWADCPTFRGFLSSKCSLQSLSES